MNWHGIFYFYCMDFNAFKNSLSEKTAPALSPALLALWFDGRGDWHSAHEIINDLTGKDLAWLHAYLHRKEGDSGNANHWYREAGKTFPSNTLDEEWELLVKYFLQEQ